MARPLTSDGITGVSGIRVGHYTDRGAATGCTVVLCDGGAVGGVDVRGSAPGTRETDLLRPTTLAPKVHAVVLTGGSAFGLDTATGVMRYLEEHRVGLRFGGLRIPIVSAAVIFDLGVITNEVRPGADEGYRACQNASSERVAEGSVGAGTGATVAKVLGRDRAVKGGIGTSAIEMGQGLVVGAIVAVNAMGGVFDPDTGKLLAGPVREDGVGMHDPMELLTSPGFGSPSRAASNTTIGVVATNARLNKEQANKLASTAHDGLAIAVRPAHLMSDGDTMFALATGGMDRRVEMDRVLAASVVTVSRAIARAVREAEGIGGIPSVKELSRDGAA